MNSRRVTPSIGLPPLGWATDTYRMLNLSQRRRQVLGADLNCSESKWGAANPSLCCRPTIAHTVRREPGAPRNFTPSMSGSVASKTIRIGHRSVSARPQKPT
jgi:hypothetical protein